MSEGGAQSTMQESLMKKPIHTNMFGHGDKAEVYALLQRHGGVELRQGIVLQLLFAAIAVIGSVASKHYDWLWIFAGLWIMEQSIWCFIDQSNRNWAMHVIDWIENDRHPTWVQRHE